MFLLSLLFEWKFQFHDEIPSIVYLFIDSEKRLPNNKTDSW